MVELEFRRRMKKGIPGRGKSRNGKNVPKRESEKLCFYGVVQCDNKGCSGKQSRKCRLGPALGRPKMPGYGIWILDATGRH